MLMKGKLCELRALQGTEYEVRRFTDGVNSGLTTQHLFTGAVPLRYIDVDEAWDKHRADGCIEFGIWVPQTPGGKLREADGWEIVGTTGLYSKMDIHRSREFRILIFDPTAVSRGVGTEATRMVTNYAFERLNAHRVWLGVSEDNVRAVKCYEKVGYKREGVLRDEIFCFGKYHNAIRYSVLESEWGVSDAK